MFLVLAGICLLLSVILSLLTYYCSYKYKGWRGILLSLGLFALYPASFIIIISGVFISIFLVESIT